MNKNIPDERLIYLAFKNVFRGADAQIRKTRKVRELVQKAQRNDDIRDLIHEHSLENVCNVAKVLLELQIFESTQKAKIRFPEVFEISPAQSAERSASEAEAARLEADAIRSAAGGQNNGDVLRSRENVQSRDDEPTCTDPPQSKLSPLKRTASQLIPHVPSLYPVYLPYQIQHQLLIKVQTILEEACYEYGVREMKDVIEREGWDCPECVELNIWARTLLANQGRLQRTDLQSLGKPLNELFDSISHLRHAAVHRLRINANALEQFLVDAERLSQLLEDAKRTACLTRLRRETQLTIGELKRNKDVLESKLHSKFRKIADERAELDRLEQLAIKEMLEDDREYQILAGANLDRAIGSSDTTTQSAAPTDVESSPESDVEPDIEPPTSSDQMKECSMTEMGVKD